MSSTSTRLFFSVSGTSPATMRCARPSTMAVLPTPGSPISTGLFLLRRCSTWIARRISSSRPITGSSLPLRARSVRSSVYFFSASRWPSASAESTVAPPRTASMAASSALRVRPWPRTTPPMSVFESASATRNISLATNWSPRLPASFSACCSSCSRSRLADTCPPPCTCGRPAIAVVHRGLQAGRVGAGAVEQGLRAVRLRQHRRQHVRRFDVRVVARHRGALAVGQGLLERRRQLVESHVGIPHCHGHGESGEFSSRAASARSISAGKSECRRSAKADRGAGQRAQHVGRRVAEART